MRVLFNALRYAGSLAVASALVIVSGQAGNAETVAGPTTDSVLAADKGLAKAIRENDPNGIVRWLDPGWAVIATSGDIGEGPSIFPDGIKSGELRRQTFEISEPRVRLYDDTALVTTKVKTSGVLHGKAFDVAERQTDVWVWKAGEWHCILTHETKIPS